MTYDSSNGVRMVAGGVVVVVEVVVVVVDRDTVLECGAFGVVVKDGHGGCGGGGGGGGLSCSLPRVERWHIIATTSTILVLLAST